MATHVSGVLKDKGHQVVTVSPNQTVASVAKVLTLNKIGAAPVIDAEDRLVGIISERDIIRLNGQQVSRLLNANRSPKGYIGLQNHHFGSRVQFRNLRIRPL